MDPFANDDQPRGRGFDPIQIVRMFLRRKWLFIIPFFLCLGMAAVAIKIQKPIYFSSAQIRVIQEPTARSLAQETPRYGGMRVDPDRETYALIGTIITSPKFLVGVVREMDLARQAIASGEFGPPPRDIGSPQEWEDRVAELLAARVENQIRTRQDGQRLFSIGVRDLNPDRAYQLTRVILERFLAEERSGRLQPTSTGRDFLEAQRDSLRSRLVAVQGRLTDLQRSMVSETLVGNPITEANLTQAEAVLTRLRSQVFDTEATEIMRLQRLVRAFLPEPPTLELYTRDPDIAAGLRELASLEFDIALGLIGSRGQTGVPADQQTPLGIARMNFHGLVSAHTAQNYPQLSSSQRTTLVEYGYNLLYRDVTQRLINRIERNIQDFRSLRARQPEQAAQVERLRAEVQTLEDQLETIERDISQETLRLQASMSEIGYKIEVRRDPRRPSAPIEPNKLRMAFMGVVLAFALGMGLVILAELLDRSFKSLPDIERALGLKVIGTLPMIETRMFAEQTQRHPWLWAATVFAILVVAAVGFLLVYPRLG